MKKIFQMLCKRNCLAFNNGKIFCLIPFQTSRVPYFFPLIKLLKENLTRLTVPCKKTRHFGNFPYNMAFFTRVKNYPNAVQNKQFSPQLLMGM